MERLRTFGATVFIASILLPGVQSPAQNICGSNAESLRTQYECKGDKWTRSECFDLALACGEYETVAANLASETKGLTLDQYYWQGMSYYGLMNRTRSNGIRCEYFTQARRSLTYFLKTSLYVLDGKDIEKKHAKPDPNKIYRVTKVVDELTKIKGCPEDGLTLNEIQQMAQTAAEETVRDVFLRPGPNQKALMDTLFKKIQDVVTNGSVVETNLGLKDVAAETQRSYLEVSILQDWAPADGNSGIGTATLSPERVLTADAGRAQKLNQTVSQPLYSHAVTLADALNRAFGGCDATHPAEGHTQQEWAALPTAIQDQKCRESAALKYGAATDFQKKSAREQIGIATLLLELTQGQNERFVKLFKAFSDNTTQIKGSAAIRPAVDGSTKNMLKMGGKVIGMDNICQEANDAEVDFWFCLKPSSAGN